MNDDFAGGNKVASRCQRVARVWARANLLVPPLLSFSGAPR